MAFLECTSPFNCFRGVSTFKIRLKQQKSLMFTDIDYLAMCRNWKKWLTKSINKSINLQYWPCDKARSLIYDSFSLWQLPVVQNNVWVVAEVIPISAVIKKEPRYVQQMQRGGGISQGVLRGCINCAGWWNFVLKPISSEHLTRHRFKKKALRIHLYLSQQKLRKLVY